MDHAAGGGIGQQAIACHHHPVPALRMDRPPDGRSHIDRTPENEQALAR
jgi:hypothetical protein